MKKKRIACFIDGFNLYHAIDNLKLPHLKWLDLKQLMSGFIDKNIHEISSVYYFSAFANWMPDSAKRHATYVKALESKGVIPVLGKFKKKNIKCKLCKDNFTSSEEKETDVNLALYLLNEAYKNNYDEAFIVSRDSDFVPAIKMLRDNFPKIRVKIIAPPDLMHSKDLARIVGKKNLSSIKNIHLERSLFAEKIEFNGETIYCPESYMHIK